MLSREEFIKESLETNLFFQRIIKEHLYFYETSIDPIANDLILEASQLKMSLETLLDETINYAKGALSGNAIQASDFITPHTLQAEEANMKLTGVPVNTGITKNELSLESILIPDYTDTLENAVIEINRKAYALLTDAIAYKNKLMTQALECKVFVCVYPEMLSHNLREEEHYLEILKALQEKTLPNNTVSDELKFWNHIMKDHAEFVDGMLDPTEKVLKQTAATTAKGFEMLVQESIQAANESQVVQKSTESTKNIRDYKHNTIVGLINCNIKSIIPPLLADHVLREANHYLKLLGKMKNS
jgi:hypothetical protein